MKENPTNVTKKCKHCQSDIPKKAKICPVCKKKQKHTLLGIVIAIIGLLMILGLLDSTEEKPTKVSNNVSESTNDSTASETPTPNPTFGVGDTAEYKGVKVTLNSVTESKGNQYNKPTEGNVFLLVNFTIENGTSDDLAVSSLLSFDAYQDDFSTTLSFTALMEKSGEQLDGNIAPGKKMQGSIGYEIPATYSEFEINYQADIWDDQKFTFIYKK